MSPSLKKREQGRFSEFSPFHKRERGIQKKILLSPPFPKEEGEWNLPFPQGESNPDSLPSEEGRG
jgi:hypothetical protein